MKNITAVSSPNVMNDIALQTNAMPSFCINDVPSKMLVIHIGLTSLRNKEASPNVKTTIRDDFLFCCSSSL